MLDHSTGHETDMYCAYDAQTSTMTPFFLPFGNTREDKNPYIKSRISKEQIDERHVTLVSIQYIYICACNIYTEGN